MKWNNVVPTENDLKENSAKLQSTFAGKHNFSIWCSFQMHYYICKKKTLTHTHANSIHRAYIEHTPKYHSLAQNQQKFYLKLRRYVITVRTNSNDANFEAIFEHFISNCLLHSSTMFDTLHATFALAIWPMWQMRRMSETQGWKEWRNLLEEQYRNNWRIHLKWNWVGLEKSDARAPTMKREREAIFGHCSEAWIGVMNSPNSRWTRTHRIRTKLHVIKIKLMD